MPYVIGESGLPYWYGEDGYFLGKNVLVDVDMIMDDDELVFLNSSTRKLRANNPNQSKFLAELNGGRTSYVVGGESRAAHAYDLYVHAFIKTYAENRNLYFLEFESAYSTLKIQNYVDHLVKFDASMKHMIFSRTNAVCLTQDVCISISKDNTDYKLKLYGDRKLCEAIKDYIGSKEYKSKLHWWFTSNGGHLSDAQLGITFNQKMFDEHYPYINKGVDKYCDDYYNSDNCVLILMGDPGTGKTSFIKHFIRKYQYNAMVTYDRNVMVTDEFYINFITSSDINLLIVEDADLLLSSREKDGNDQMRRLLNLSDGLIKFPTKKIIFSTNLYNMVDIDDAITRPGRCHDILKFKKLSYDEAVKVVELHGLPELLNKKDEYSLAEIFNRELFSDSAKTKIGLI